MKRVAIFVFLLGLLPFSMTAQTGGRNAFQFVNLPGDAHTAAIGGMNQSVYDADVNMVWQNPALLRDTMNKFLSIGYIPFYAGIKGGSMSYSHKFKKIGTLAAGIKYINYGSMIERDDTGNETGSFRPQDLMFTVAKSHTISVFTLGASLKYISSVITPKYSAYALMVDLGGIYRHPKRDFTVGMTIKNVGFAILKYNKEAPAYAPFDTRLGTTYKFEHVPLRVSLTAHHLHQFDIVYLDSTQFKEFDIDGVEKEQKKTFSDKLLRHFVIGTEFILSKNLNFRLAYDFQRRREMRLANKRGGVGFSWGFMLRVKSFEFDFSRATYSLAGGKNWVTLTMDMDRLLSRR